MNKFVLKEGPVFVVSDESGNISGNLGEGLYYRDMRHLSYLRLTVNGTRPDVLSSSSEQNFMGNIQYANPAMSIAGMHLLPHSFSIRRNRFLHGGLHERIELMNYIRIGLPVRLVLVFAADFRDMFDIRGYRRRTSRGQLLAPEQHGDTVVLQYLGLDEVMRTTEIRFELPPSSISIEEVPPAAPRREEGATLPDATVPLTRRVSQPPMVTVTFDLFIEPHQPVDLTMHIVTTDTGDPPALVGFEDRALSLGREYEEWLRQSAAMETDDEVFNRFMLRSQLDLRLLTEALPTGLFPTAGIPWFAAPFGRDSLVTSLQTLAFNPEIAIGTLRFLARYQGKAVNSWRDEEPGKILHELRFGEMARLNEVPHTPYYGSIDATPLFVVLFAETMQWLDDDNLYEELLPAVLRALEWIDRYGDLDGDGFIEYQSRSARGIRNQGWKDSKDSVQYLDGKIAKLPIALAEVQGYVYWAKCLMADLLERKQESSALVATLRRQAARLREQFEQAFWMEDQGFYAMALDGDKRQIPLVTSNPGHCLLAGMVDRERANRLVERLMRPDLLSGWGIRTMSTDMPCYNPMSYHNGTVWPHDNSLVLAGIKRYGFDAAANEIITQIFQASMRFRYFRLPELYCSFPRDLRYYSVPAEYPVSCSPQAWASGTPPLVFQSMLGLRAEAHHRTLYLRPRLPYWLESASIQRLRLGPHRLDLLVQREGDGCRVEVQRNDGNIKVEVE